MTEKKKKAHYIDNKMFYDEIVKYKQQVKEAEEQGKPKPRINNYLGECLDRLAKHVATMPKFINYSFKDEMISDAVENCLVYFHNFDINRTNPFAYFTQVVYYAFLRRIAKEERERYTKYKIFRDTMMDTDEISRLVDSDDNNIGSPKMYDNINAFMERFEAKEAEKKRKRKELKELQKFATIIEKNDD